MATPLRHSQSSTLYLFSDDTGQKSGGNYFVVAVVAISGDRSAIEQALRAIEGDTGKGTGDWASTAPACLSRYYESVLGLQCFDGCLCFIPYEGFAPKDLLKLRADALIRTANRFEDTQRLIVVPEGLNGMTRRLLLHSMRRRFSKTEVWNGAFEKHALVRLADTCAGQVASALYEPHNPRFVAEIGVRPFTDLRRIYEPPARDLWDHVGGQV